MMNTVKVPEIGFASRIWAYARAKIGRKATQGGDINIAESDAAAKKPCKIEITEVRDTNDDGATDLVDVEHLLKNSKNALTLLEGDGDFRFPECIKLVKSET